MSDLQRIAIFKVGTHTATNGESLNATAEYLKSVVDGYSPNIHESPAVIGHPKDNHPAYGWVQSLSFDDGVLYANFKDVEPNFAQMLKDKRFKKRSASFYPPNHPTNPTKGKPYLRHVGFLGAQPPAVKGLKDFTDDADCPTYEFSELSEFQTNHNNEDTPMSKEKAPTATPSNPPQSPLDKVGSGVVDFAEQQAQLAKQQKALADREAEIAEREKAFAKQQQDAKTAEFSEYCDGLIKTGQVVPAEKDAIVAVMMTLDANDKTFDFAENGTVKQKSSVEVLQDVLSRLDTTVDFSERSASDPNTADKPEHGFNTSEKDEEALHQKYLDYSEKNGVSYAEAVAHFA